MKKSLLALAVLGAFAGAASAQSSVTIYGQVDLGVGKPIGSEDKQVLDASGSRLGFRGVEDLGGGLKALFGFEHRLSPDTGTSSSSNFWNGYSTVGLSGAFGTVNLGRQYVPTFTMIQNQIDPFGGDTQGALRGVGMMVTTIGKVRVTDSIRYDFSASGFNLGASVGEAASNAGTKRPFAIAANYAAGPLFIGAGYENPADEDDKLFNIGARYDFGFATLSAGFGKGTTAGDLSAKSFLIGANVPVGGGDFKVGYAQTKLEDFDLKKFSIGYHYPLSKRTKIYADFGKISGDLAVGPKSGYDLGILHKF